MTPPAAVIQSARGWVRVRSFVVRGLRAPALLVQLLLQVARGHCRRPLRPWVGPTALVIAQRLAEFLGSPPEEKVPEEKVPPAALRAVAGMSSPGRQGLRPGSLARLQKTGRVVVVVARHLEVDVEALAAALDVLPELTLQEPPVWHCARLHHRCRLLFPPESPCERVGSHMSALWCQRQGLQSGPFCDRVLLAQAHVKCLGSARDDFIVREVARLMLEKRRRRHSARKSADLAQIRRAGEVLQQSGRMSEPSDSDDVTAMRAATSGGRGCGREVARQQRRDGIASRRPSELPRPMTAALALSQSREGTLQAPPLNLQDLHHRARSGGDHNSLRDAISRWWTSPAGRAWSHERRQMFRGTSAPHGE